VNKVFSIKRRLNQLSFDRLSTETEIIWVFKAHCYSIIARCTLILQVAAPMLLRVAWALLRLLVIHTPQLTLTTSQSGWTCTQRNSLALRV